MMNKNESGVLVRQAIKSDAQKIRELISLYPEKLMQDDVPDLSSFFVAHVNETLVGCCALVIYSKRIAEIRSLSVAVEYQGMGVASQLIKQCMQKAQKLEIHEVFAVTGAKTLFEKHGFGTFNSEKYAMLKVVTPRSLSSKF